MVSDSKSEISHDSTAPSTAHLAAAAGRVRFVLVRPSHPGNIGAAARAIKVMGFTRLVLVQPKTFPHPEAVSLASRATDVLDAAAVTASLEAALAGVTHAYAFTARPRDLSHQALPLRAAAAEGCQALAAAGDIALVFGNETFGLANDEVMRCNRLAFIPANGEYESLNLAQAVQVAAYEFAEALRGPAAPPQRSPRPATRDDVEGLVRAIESAAITSGFLDPAKPKRLMQRLRRLFARADIEPEEVALLRGIVAALARSEPAPAKPQRLPS